MRYKLVDENGEIQAEFDIGEKHFPQLLERLMSITTLQDVALYTPTEITLLEQMRLLAEQSRDNPELSAKNSEAMCAIAVAIKTM